MDGNIVIVSKRSTKKIGELTDQGWTVIDVTSKSPDYSRLSPFFPHGGVCVENENSMSVEGLWQGLKVFENSGVDRSKFSIKSMQNLKRSTRKHGKVLGHMLNNDVISYIEARQKIYIPAYRYVLENKVSDIINKLMDILRDGQKLVLLDYTTNGDIFDTSKPLSHAACIKDFLLKKIAE